MRNGKYLVNRVIYVGGKYNEDQVYRNYARKNYRPLEADQSHTYFSLGTHLLKDLKPVISDAVQQLDIAGGIQKFLTNIYDKFKKIPFNTSAVVNPFMKLGVSRHTSKVCIYTPFQACYAFLVRHIGTPLIPDPDVVTDFAEFVKNELQQAFERVPNFQFNTVQDYLDSVDISKRHLYEQGYKDFKEVKWHKLANPTYELIMKSMEVATSLDKAELKDLKPRNLFNPPPIVKVMLGYLNWNCIQLCKKMYPDTFIQGMNTEQVSDAVQRLQRKIKDPTFMMWDGSNYDAHQHFSLISAVDNVFFDKIFERIFFYTSEFSKEEAQILKEACQKMVVKVTMMEPTSSRTKNKVKYFGAKIRGTTFTGHPTRTTLGNTLRMMFYTKYIASKNNIDIQSCHAGDDVVVILNKQDVKIFRQAIDAYAVTCRVEDLIHQGYNERKYKSYGLGQIFRGFKQNDTCFDFLSKDGFAFNGHIYMRRILRRVILSGTISDSVGTTLTQNQQNAAITIAHKAYEEADSRISDLIQERLTTLPHDDVCTKTLEKNLKEAQNEGT